MLVGAIVDEGHGRRPIKFGVVEQPRAQLVFDVDFGGRVQLVGASLPQTANRGDQVNVSLQLLVERDCSNTSPKVLIQADESGGRANVAHAEHLPVAGKLSSADWYPGDLLLDETKLTIPADVVSDEIVVWASISDNKTRWLTHPKHRDDRVEIGRIRLEKAPSTDAGF